MSNHSLSRVVLVTNGNVHAVRVLEGLKNRGLYVEAIVYERSLRLSDYIGRTDRATERIRALLRAFGRWGISPSKRVKAKRLYSQYCSNVIPVGGINSTETREELLRLKPSWILLGGIGILKPLILDTATIGVLNSHVGLLPWARGTGVVGRSLERGYPVGVTCHYVNAGVDTGPIIERRLLRVTGKERSLKELETANDLLAAEVMIDVIARFLAQNQIPQGIPQHQRFPPCKWLSLSERRTADRRIRDGLALQLLGRWQRAGLTDGALTLQAGVADCGEESDRSIPN